VASEELMGLSYDGFGLIIAIVILIVLVILFWFYFNQHKKLRQEVTMIKMQLRKHEKKDS
jgi:uncharacterized membrane protein